jgi:hypothetical protein
MQNKCLDTSAFIYSQIENKESSLWLDIFPNTEDGKFFSNGLIDMGYSKVVTPYEYFLQELLAAGRFMAPSRGYFQTNL